MVQAVGTKIATIGCVAGFKTTTFILLVMVGLNF